MASAERLASAFGGSSISWWSASRPLLIISGFSCPGHPGDVMIRGLQSEADEMYSFVVRRIGLVEECG